MASEVDIANIALSHLGDDATVASLDPPEGSAQAEHCARFYPVARDSLLESHNWAFSTQRIAMAEIANPPPSPWRHVYQAPSDVINMLAVWPNDALDDYSAALSPVYSQQDFHGINRPSVADQSYSPQQGVDTGAAFYTPQPYVTETDSQDRTLIFTNQKNAVLHYTRRVTDTTKFSPLFVEALTRMLASLLAGPVLKGDTGRKEGMAQRQIANQIMAAAAISDANQRKVITHHNVGWIGGR